MPNDFLHPLIKQGEEGNKSNAWENDYIQKINELLLNREANIEDLAKIIFKYGIIERLAPEDMERMKARKDANRKVWLQGQNDPKLYWSIMYSAAHLINSSEKGQKVTAGPVAIAYNIALNILVSSNSLFRFIERGENPGVLIGQKIYEVARQELEKRDKKQKHDLIHIGASGLHNRKKSTVVGYHPEGKIIMEVYSDMADMLDADSKFNTTAYPWELDPEEFKAREIPKLNKLQ